MNMSFLQKIGTVFKYMFSSFVSIELFLLSLLLFLILIINIRLKKKYITASSIVIYIGFLIGIVVSHLSYAKTCIDAFLKGTLNYIYFPSTVAYFFIIVFITIMMIYSILSNKLTTFKKVFNYMIFSIMYFFFSSFVAVATFNKIDFSNITELYKHDIILSIVQVSNLLLVGWILFTLFYKLFVYFKTKFD